MKRTELEADRTGTYAGPAPRAARGPRRNRAFTLMEVVVTMTILGVLISIPAPLFSKAIEQSRYEIAAANLQAIWNAQRFYYLENRRYAATLDELGDLVDASLRTAGGSYYHYDVASADGQGFAATATHPETPRCSGAITIDHSGRWDGEVLFNGRALARPQEFAK